MGGRGETEKREGTESNRLLRNLTSAWALDGGQSSSREPRLPSWGMREAGKGSLGGTGG